MEGLEYNPSGSFEMIKTRSNNISYEFITPKDYILIEAHETAADWLQRTTDYFISNENVQKLT